MNLSTNVLLLCTDNICRSPSAELLARHRYGDEAIKFRSAGFVPGGAPCPAELIEVLMPRGIDATYHRSYEVDSVSLAAADLILTMEESHVRKVTFLDRQSFYKTLPIREAADLLSNDTFSELHSFLHEANQGRNPYDYMDTRWDIADPYQGAVVDYRETVEEIALLIEAVSDPLLNLVRS